MGTVQIDEVLSSLDIGPFQRRLLVICGLGFAAAAMEIVVTAFIFVELRAAWSLTEYQLSLIPVFVGITSFAGKIFWGIVADTHGRRLVFMVTVIIICVGGIASAFAANIIQFYVLRSIVSFGYAGNIAVDFAVFTEFLPIARRGEFLFYLAAFWPAGQFLTSMLAWTVIPTYGWRYFLGACAVPTLLVSFLRPLIPESPRWLLLNGFHDEAEGVLRQIADFNSVRHEEVGLSGEVRLELNKENVKLQQSTLTYFEAVLGLFENNLLRTTLGMVVYTWALGALSYVVGTLMPTLLEKKGIAQDRIYETMVLASMFEFLGLVAAQVVGSFFGRVQVLQVSFIPICAALCFFAGAESDTISIIWTCVASGVIEFAWAFYHCYLPEVFPTQLRATATGAITAFNAVVEVFIPLVAAHLMSSEGGILKTVLMFCGIAAVATTLQLFLLHDETKDCALKDYV